MVHARDETSIREDIQEIKELLSNNTVKKQELQGEIQKGLNQILTKVDKRLGKYESKLNNTIRKYGVNQLEEIEARLLANNLAIHLLVPPITLGFLICGYAIKNGHKVDFWNLMRDPGKEISKVFTVAASSGVKSGDYSDETKVRTGMTIEGFKVTDEIRLREKHPVHGGRSFHKGVDVATPIGTPLYALGKSKITCHYQAGGAGKFAIVEYTEKDFVLMHLSTCKAGTFYKGDVFAKTGDTGIGTGPHLHLEQYSKGFARAFEPPTVGYVTGFLNRTYGSKDKKYIAIGAAEGTLTPGGEKTKAYNSHIDPGNKKRNQGMFSYQHPAKNAKEADKKQLAKLKKFELWLKGTSKQYGMTLTERELVNGLDLFNQSEAAGYSYITQLNAKKRNILAARVATYYNPKTGKLEAAGFGNDLQRLKSDQKRRMDMIDKTL